MSGTTVGGYEITRELGRGTFGTVYAAKRGQGELTYALKKLRLGSSGADQVLPHLRELKEIQQEARDSEVPILRLVEFLHQDDAFWLVTRYCDEGSLSDFLLLHPETDENQTVKFMVQISEAVKFLHSNGIVHGGLNMDNMLVTGQFGGFVRGRTIMNYTIKVSDYGIARMSGEDIFMHYYYRYDTPTRYFTAPEVQEQVYTKESDVFSMGAIFAAMLDRTTLRIAEHTCIVPFIIPDIPFGQALDTSPDLNISEVIMKTVATEDSLKTLIVSMLATDPEFRPTAEFVNERLHAIGNATGAMAAVFLGIAVAVFGALTGFWPLFLVGLLGGMLAFYLVISSG
ncbi:PREDICTED: serine/threonine-protein kinase PDIK1L-like [Branchiostoma belcheri]|uniref:Serine/threonine-protein kinase PDIK1L-like n=1 Tax=Branchiostoma belcheri TaxID=7741 RepID=A0A6P5A004_BRABE|nr:PREDICTED: serine/threonine-protein kinase PDIK1L-like [Branchiostoma belcheri]